ncbi:MAG TPA: DinB family protein [Candidatus Dormibacteraeota bacterium]|nr:DinB family protein [Candidatus Dormibacteraeota bacterium]
MEADQSLARDDVLTMLGACPERVRDYVGGLDANRLGYRHAPAFPTLGELILHVSDTGSAADTVLRHALIEGAQEVDARSALEPVGDGHDATQPAQERLEDLGRLRRRTMDLLRGLTAEDWDRVVIDPAVGEMTILDFCRLVAAHEMSHLSQVRNLMALLPE